jgi:hypothetical protein
MLPYLSITASLIALPVCIGDNAAVPSAVAVSIGCIIGWTIPSANRPALDGMLENASPGTSDHERVARFSDAKNSSGLIERFADFSDAKNSSGLILHLHFFYSVPSPHPSR